MITTLGTKSVTLWNSELCSRICFFQRITSLSMSSYKFNHLFKHDEQCFDFINSEFTYSMCPFKSMEQESLTSLSRDIHNLGIVLHSQQVDRDF